MGVDEGANDDFGDVHLQSASPCINMGNPYGDYTGLTDMDGDPRVMGVRVDMGADEYFLLTADVDIVPDTLNLKSNGRWITCFIQLPEGYDVVDISSCNILLGVGIEAESIQADGKRQFAMAKFSRSEVQNYLDPGEVELTVIGKLSDETRFEGTDIIRVIDKGNNK